MIMGHSKHELNTKKRILFEKKNCHVTPLPPNNGHFDFFLPQVHFFDVHCMTLLGDVKRPNATFYGADKQTTTNFPLLF